ncbi:MAG: hypothetical protein ACLRRU_02500 [Faecalibacterium sp.]
MKTAVCSTQCWPAAMNNIAAHRTGILQYMKDNAVDFRILEEPLLVTGLGIAFARTTPAGWTAS